jgi:Zn-dependent M28 family amino/carboxypeptidase
MFTWCHPGVNRAAVGPPLFRTEDSPVHVSLRTLAFLALPSIAVSCAPPAQHTAPLPESGAAAAAVIDGERLLANISVLASDEFEGRSPGSRGEDLTVAFLIDAFASAGLAAGNPDGTWVQNVSLVGFRATPTAALRVGDRSLRMRFPEDFVAVSRRFDLPEVRIEDSEVVFVGYGVVAPEYGWDDFKDVDVRGKTVVMLINDPAVPDPADPSRLDPAMFRGEAMTYYGRWTYKYEIASERGAAAAIIVHETGPAGYPYEVVEGSWGQENFDIRTADLNAGRVPVEGWITEGKARELFSAGGQDFDALKAAAVRRDFRPVPLGATADFAVRNTTRDVESRNVIGKLEGSHPERRHEYVVYTAHWDHLGTDGTQIWNGAVDNASGTAGIVEIAHAFSALPARPDRTILFLAVTAEERGLLGAKHYGTSPLYPLERTLANINVDGLNQWGRTRDVVLVGYGNSTMDEVVKAQAAVQGRVVKPDPEPEKGFFFRSDHFEFAKQGVPAIFVNPGTEFVGRDPAWGLAKRAEYTANDYHKPSDTVKPDWDLSGAVEDLRLLFGVGLQVASGDRWPEWKEGSEFRARRLEMLRAATP